MLNLYIYCHNHRATDMLATFLDDGSNLPDIRERRLRHVFPVPGLYGDGLKSWLARMSAEGCGRIGVAPAS